MHVIAMRTGDVPLQFEGDLIAEASSHWMDGRENSRWHELHLFRTTAGTYVLEIAFRSLWQGEPSLNSAFICQDAAAVREAITSYEPVPAGVGYKDMEVHFFQQSRLAGRLACQFQTAVSILIAQSAIGIGCKPPR